MRRRPTPKPVVVDGPPHELVRYREPYEVDAFCAWLCQRADWRRDHHRQLPAVMHPQDRLYLGYTAGIPAALRVAEQVASHSEMEEDIVGDGLRLTP